MKSESAWKKMGKKECEKAQLFNCPSCDSDSSSFFRKIDNNDGGLFIRCGSCGTVWLELQRPEELKQNLMTNILSHVNKLESRMNRIGRN